jgi:hypothetical protein
MVFGAAHIQISIHSASISCFSVTKVAAIFRIPINGKGLRLPAVPPVEANAKTSDSTKANDAEREVNS